MTTAERDATLRRVFSRVLEQLAYMFADAPETEQPALEGGLLLTCMTFGGIARGTMSIVVPEGLAPLLAANVLGLDPGDPISDAASRDALKELLNITCGNVLTELFGEDPVLTLSVPAIEGRTTHEWRALRCRLNTVYLTVDDFPVLIHLSLEGGDGCDAG